MRLIHISDLHFGAHDEGLRRALQRRLKGNPPDALVCTGDLVDEPTSDLMNRAKQFLAEISSDWNVPTVVVPGNHDYKSAGWLPGRKSIFEQFFGSRQSEQFVRSSSGSVWIFGFDSAKEGATGGSGKITQAELRRFHQRYEDLMEKEPTFEGAFKIVAVHHHPLPVRSTYSPSQPFLTMRNAGEFLNALLFRQIDLLLHGHEHEQAHAGFQSSLAKNDHRVNILSLGATLKSSASRGGGNWFAEIDVDDSVGSVIRLFSSGPNVWENEAAETLLIETAEAVRAFQVKKIALKQGFSYRRVDSFTFLNLDGDARRIVECSGLEVTGPPYKDIFSHTIQLPETLGYIDGLVAEGEDFSLSIMNPLPRHHHVTSWTARLQFDKPLAEASYKYGWWAINAFAMDTLQLQRLYRQPHEQTEFTNFIVMQPIESLAIHLQFPLDYRLPGKPQIRVSAKRGSPDDVWVRDPAAEQQLSEAGALQYHQLLHLATLHVAWPLLNTSYGIEWTVPEAVAQQQDEPEIADLEAARDIWQKQPLTVEERRRLLQLISHVGNAAIQMFCTPWDEPYDVSLMYFDDAHTLSILAAADLKSGNLVTERAKSNLEFSYGLGVAGRAFKVNDVRVYQARGHRPSAFRDQPDAYEEMPGTKKHKVMASFPLHLPVDDETFTRDPQAYQRRVPYGVLSIGSGSSGCPLGALGSRSRQDVVKFQHFVNDAVFTAVKEIFLMKAVNE